MSNNTSLLLRSDNLPSELPEELAGNLQNLVDYMTGNVEGMDVGSSFRYYPDYIAIHQPTSNRNLPGVQIGSLCTAEEVLISRPSADDALEVYPLMVFKTRQYWLEGADRPECRSLDAINGSRYGKCSTCEFSRWVDNKPSPCSDMITAYVLSEDMSAIYRVDFKGSSHATGRRLISMFGKGGGPGKFKVVLYTEKHPKRPTYLFQIAKGASNRDESILKVVRQLSAHFTQDRKETLERFEAKRNEVDAVFDSDAGAADSFENDGALDM